VIVPILTKISVIHKLFSLDRLFLQGEKDEKVRESDPVLREKSKKKASTS